MTRAFIIVACLVVILAGIKVSASLVVPFLLAVFLAILLAPPFLSMKRKGMPGAVAIIVMILGLGVLGVLTVTILRALSVLAEPARSPSRPPTESYAMGGREGERAGADSQQTENALEPRSTSSLRVYRSTRQT
jgi:hypothetical protein